MYILNIIFLFIIVCFAQISGQSTDCERIFRSCTNCARTVPQRDELNHRNNCPRVVERRWEWRNITQCEIQRLYC
ncbi:hypothetical protein KR044_011871, partial [Drosophila immigrans]